MQTIIVPDIHGRKFWKTLEKSWKPDYDVIFLGDYLDPYAFEGITPEEALDNFKEIISFKKAHKYNITLLLGNHDLEYLSEIMPACRCDYKHKEEIACLFRENIDLFDIGITREIEGMHYSFTHAPLLKDWVNLFKKGLTFAADTPDKIISNLNDMFHSKEDGLYIALAHCSYYRGGNHEVGSVIWADLTEIDKFNAEYEGWYEIFGHTQQLSREMCEEIYSKGKTDKLANPVINDYFACLDCKRIFTIANGNVQLFE
jgi:hypothetical protein